MLTQVTSIGCALIWIALTEAHLPAQQTADELLQGIERTGDDVFLQRLEALAAKGPQAATAMPFLQELVAKRNLTSERLVGVASALAELAPFRTPGFEVDDKTVDMALVHTQIRGRGTAATDAVIEASSRLKTRSRFPIDLDLDDLTAMTRSHDPWRVETAIDLLWVRGHAAASALPALQELLARPEPRRLLGTGTVPIHRKVARAVASIEPDGEVAKLCAEVLLHPPIARDVEVPARLRERIATLIPELEVPASREAAAANLHALGAPAAGPLAALLTKDRSPEVVATALRTLRDLGPDATTVLSQVFEALWTLSSEHTVAVLEALTEIAPWSHYLLPEIVTSGSANSLSICGHRLEGVIDAEFLDAFHAARLRYHAAVAVDPDARPTELRKALTSPILLHREFALLTIRRRGPAAHELLPDLREMLDATQPKDVVVHFNGAGEIDRTDDIQRLAAETILAIGRADDPAVAAAKQRLAR